MAMTNCSECHKEVSSQAESCPHCGNRLKDTWQEKNTKVAFKFLKIWLGCLGVGALLVVLFAGLAAFFGTR